MQVKKIKLNSTYLWNTGILPQYYMVSQLRTIQPESSPM